MTVVQTRVDDKTRKQAGKVLNGLGITIGDGIRMFLRQVHIDKGLPFKPTLVSHIPNSKTIKKISDGEVGIGIKTFKTKESLFKDLGL